MKIEIDTKNMTSMDYLILLDVVESLKKRYIPKWIGKQPKMEERRK